MIGSFTFNRFGSSGGPNSVRSAKKLCALLFSTFLLLSLSAQDKLRNPLPELPVASWEEGGFMPDSIQSLVDLIAATPPRDFRGLVVIKDNQLVIEQYFHTFWRNSIHDIRSAGKSITALLLGVAMKEGLVQSLEQDVYSFFPKGKYPSVSEGFKDVTLQHLLDMSSGLDADTNDPATFGQAANFIARDEWVSYLLQTPLVGTPGEEWLYADINAVLIGAVIEETSGMSLKDFAKKYVFDPLDIRQYYWYTNASNQTGGAGNLYLSTLDFAKLGLLVLNKGRWNGHQIIELDYIDRLSSRACDLSDEYGRPVFYGMLWYKATEEFGGRTFDYLFASGNGGNHLVVFPDEEMVIALTSSAYGRGPGHRRSYNIMSKVLEAMK